MKIVKFVVLLVMFSAISGLLSCSGSGSETSAPQQPAVDTTNQNQESGNRQALDNKEVTFTNPMEFALSVDTLRTWGLLCQYSKWSSELRGSHYTLLCPKINLLKTKGKDFLVALRDKKNQDLLNDLVAAHILKTDVSVDKWKFEEEYETIDGRKYRIGSQVIRDIVYYTYQIYTPHGNVVVTENLLEFPDKELEARIAKK